MQTVTCFRMTQTIFDNYPSLVAEREKAEAKVGGWVESEVRRWVGTYILKVYEPE